MSVSLYWGKIPYGYKELSRTYKKYMTLSLFVSCILTSILILFLKIFFNEEKPQANNFKVIRIFKYSEIELPSPLGSINTPISAFPIIENNNIANFGNSITARNIFGTGKNERRSKEIGDDYSHLEIDKISSTHDEKGSPFGNPNERDKNDIAGGKSPNTDLNIRSGNPVAANSGNLPSGVDNSGLGGSSKIGGKSGPIGIGNNGGGNGEDGAFSLSWSQGIFRKKMSGDLPKYPQGVNITAQIKILVTVDVNGNVVAMKPIQKANSKLEDASMSALRFWKFEKLKKEFSQVEQNCVVTFYFVAN